MGICATGILAKEITRECEEVIQELLREIDPGVLLPALMEPVREEDHAGAVCYRPTGELYLGHRRGRIGNEGGFKEDQIADYSFSTRWKRIFSMPPDAGLRRRSILRRRIPAAQLCG
jgi:hypothetical protein